MRRLFLAVPVPARVHEYREALKAANASIEGIKWMRLHNLHLTVYFIGNVANEKVDKVMSCIRSAVASQSTFSLGFENVSLAPSRDPRMIWAKYHKNVTFSDLSARIHTSLSGIIPENKFFYKDPIPHITLARFQPVVAKKHGIGIVEAMLPQLDISSIELWESLPSPEGVKYVSVECLQFGQ